METKFEGREANSHDRRYFRFPYFLVGVGIGAAVSVFFAPKSGEETRKKIAARVFNAVENANQKVWQSRAQVKEYVDHRQQQVSEFLAAGRDKLGLPVSSPKVPVS